MRRGSVAITLAQGALVAGLAFAVGWALEGGQGAAQRESVPVPTVTPTPYPTCIDRFWLPEPSVPCMMPVRTLNPVRAATATARSIEVATWAATRAPELTAAAAWRATDEAGVMAGIDRTPCAVPPTPLPFTYYEAEEAPCFSPYVEQTQAARIANGETYIVSTSREPDGTPVVSFTGTVPPAAQAWYTALPATHTAAVATAVAEATAGLPNRAMRADQRQDRVEMRRYWRDATATAQAIEGAARP